MRILFLGAGAFGVPTLAALATDPEFRVVGVVSQPDRPAGRGGKMTPTPISAWTLEQARGMELIRAENVNEEPVLGRIRSIAADAWVVIAFGQKLSPALLADRTAVNLHASLLPRWRGAAPINAAILAGDAQTGNSVITLAERMDAGLVLGTSTRPIGASTTAGELHDALSADGPALMRRVLLEIRGHGIRGEKQDESLVTKAKKLSRADAWVDFSQSAEECRRRINGLSPWPGVTVKIEGKDVRLLRSEVTKPMTLPGKPAHGETGIVIDSSTGDVACGSGSVLRMLEVQPSGGTAMSWADFARGRRIVAGTQIVAGRHEC